jgi:hypothetical protein
VEEERSTTALTVASTIRPPARMTVTRSPTLNSRAGSSFFTGRENSTPAAGVLARCVTLRNARRRDQVQNSRHMDSFETIVAAILLRPPEFRVIIPGGAGPPLPVRFLLQETSQCPCKLLNITITPPSI